MDTAVSRQKNGKSLPPPVSPQTGGLHKYQSGSPLDEAVEGKNEQDTGRSKNKYNTQW